MSDIVQVVPIVTPKQGKIDEVRKKMTPYNAFVEAKEFGTLRYEIFRQVNRDAEVLVYLEAYKDQAAREAHSASDEHAELMKKAAEDWLLACPPEIKELRHVGGFAWRKYCVED